MSVYLIIVILVLGVAILFPENPHNRKIYIIIMATIHTFICGFKYMYLSGDLIKYAGNYYRLQHRSWLDLPSNNGSNILWFALLRLFSGLSGGDFQVFLFFQALFVEVVLALFIYHYSACPWLSYLVWNCMSMYIYGFSAIKQSTAMAVIMIAMMGVLEDKPLLFYISVLIGGLIHFPAFCFLPVYAIRNQKTNEKMIIILAMIIGIIFLFRNPIVNFMSQLYYAEAGFSGNAKVGLRFGIILGIAVAGFLLRGTWENKSQKLLHVIIIAAVLQMFSGYSNVFTRLADYYFQFSILFIPLFFADTNVSINQMIPEGITPVFGFDEKNRSITILVLVLLLIIFYYYSGFSHAVQGSPIDNIWTYRSMWSH